MSNVAFVIDSNLYLYFVMCYRVRRNWCWLLLAGLLLIHGVKTRVRNVDWESEYSIFMAGLKVNDRNAKLFNNVGHALESLEKYGEALFYFQKAVR